MSIANLSHVLRIFGGNEISAEEENELFREVLLMTLARASSSDSNTHPVEIDSVVTIIKRATGEDVSAGDVRVAAASELYETAPLEKYLTGCGRKLSPSSRSATINALAEVIKSDTEVTSREVEFFDMVARALGATPAELAGLVAD